ncbi:MAG: hypothetical protein K2G01_03165 [Paramuribaculum sp.]|nr:hypothetical protein [Paramuribaculum sp.]
MKKIAKYISSALMVAALGATFTACDDWTEPEHVDLDYGTIDTANPEAYVKYLENLRAYRNSDHKLVYAWFDNVETAFGSQGHRISAIPDSVDVIVLNNPDKVTNQLVQEMFEARTNKGQQFSYVIDFDVIKADYTLLCEQLAAKRIEFININGEDAEIPAELKDPEFLTYLTESCAAQLKHFNTVGFDGLVAGFAGKPTNHMTQEELNAYKDQAALFLGIIEDWHQRNPSVAIDLLCKPQYIDSPLLAEARRVFLVESLDASSIDSYSYYVALADNAVPESKLGVLASVPDHTGADEKLGYFANGTLAVNGMAKWAAGQNIGAVGIYNTGADYFLTNGFYTNVRYVIETVNPSAK